MVISNFVPYVRLHEGDALQTTELDKARAFKIIITFNLS